MLAADQKASKWLYGSFFFFYSFLLFSGQLRVGREAGEEKKEEQEEEEEGIQDVKKYEKSSK